MLTRICQSRLSPLSVEDQRPSSDCRAVHPRARRGGRHPPLCTPLLCGDSASGPGAASASKRRGWRCVSSAPPSTPDIGPSFGGGRGAPSRNIPITSRQSRLGWAKYAPLVLSPATGPSHCAALGYSLRKAGRRQERHHLCGNLVFGPPYFIRRPSVLCARRTWSLMAAHPTHSASWARLAFVRCETQTRHRRCIGERCRP
jgi:hypothetical protein